MEKLENKPVILKAPNIYDVAFDDLPSNVSDSELLLDAEIQEKLRIIQANLSSGSDSYEKDSENT